VHQKAVDYSEYYRCYVVGQKHVRVMAYDPARPHADRYVQEAPACSKKLLRRMERDAQKLCRALGYDVNSVEFAVADGVPYAIDFMNPVPDADLRSVGAANFEWVVDQMADLAIAKAKSAPEILELRWAVFLGAEASSAKAAPKKKAAKKKKTKKTAVKTKNSRTRAKAAAEAVGSDQAEAAGATASTQSEL
jgi:hypothetical protein